MRARAGKRPAKVAEEARAIVAGAVQQRVHDPRLAEGTITETELSPDLRQLRIYFSVLGDEERVRQAEQGFESASGYLRRILAERLRMRYAPTLTFRVDHSLRSGSRIEELLLELRDEDRS